MIRRIACTYILLIITAGQESLRIKIKIYAFLYLSQERELSYTVQYTTKLFMDTTPYVLTPTPYNWDAFVPVLPKM